LNIGGWRRDTLATATGTTIMLHKEGVISFLGPQRQVELAVELAQKIVSMWRPLRQDWHGYFNKGYNLKWWTDTHDVLILVEDEGYWITGKPRNVNACIESCSEYDGSQ
jgi:hypothetical protein